MAARWRYACYLDMIHLRSTGSLRLTCVTVVGLGAPLSQCCARDQNSKTKTETKTAGYKTKTETKTAWFKTKTETKTAWFKTKTETAWSKTKTETKTAWSKTET